MVGRLRVSTVSGDEALVKAALSSVPNRIADVPGQPSLTRIGRPVPRMRPGIWREILHMKEKRVSAAGAGGTRRHGDPPAWLNLSLPLEKRRTLLDRAIKEMAAAHRAGAAPDKP